jgi:hypothetical protein
MSYRSFRPTKLHLTPLTEENLDKMNHHSMYDPLSVYASSVNEAPGLDPRIQPPPHCQLDSLKRPKRRSRDTVVESPRLLPFPYHNDGQFLPTVEKSHQYYQKRRTTGSGSFTDLSLRSKRTSISPSVSLSPQRAASVPPPGHRPSTCKRHTTPPPPSTTSSSSSFDKVESFFVRLVGAIKKKRASWHDPVPGRS